MKAVFLCNGLLIALFFIDMGAAVASVMKPCPNSPKSEQQGDFVSSDWHNCMGFFEDSGTVYIGVFQSGDYHGVGTIFYSTGGKYEGEFKLGIPFGQGVFTDPDGVVAPTCYGQIRAYGVYFCAPPAILRFAFSNQSAIHRKQIQIKLRAFGYKREIDGLYGRGTAEALLVFNMHCTKYDLEKPGNSEKLIKIMLMNGFQSDYNGIYEVASDIYNNALDRICKGEEVTSPLP
jgi:hypothetical protein